jgi:hypothetical protein
MNRIAIVFLTLLASTAGVVILSQVVKVKVREKSIERKVSFEDVSYKQAKLELGASRNQNREAFRPLPKPVAFEKVDPFDSSAWSWNEQFDQYGGCSVLVFDANGDNLPDVFFGQNGQSWTKPTDANSVMESKPIHRGNALFINQGNDSLGNPRFTNATEITKTNTNFQKEELLFEGFLFPRISASDSSLKDGRMANYAVAADLNGDGRLDLVVGNDLQGIFWSDPKTQHVLQQFVNPVGRESRGSKQAMPGFGIALRENYVPHNGCYNDSVISSRGREFEGANTLYLNMGDSDNDGLPEWKDVSREAGIEGRGATMGISVADIDLDGDLDMYVANGADPDYWIGGSAQWAGGTNELFINLLKETGELKFAEAAKPFGVDGVFNDSYKQPAYWKLRKIPFLPEDYSVWLMKFEAFLPSFLKVNGEEGEHAEVSWATTFQDVNHDGYPDIWVANDMGYMRLYINDRGIGFTNSSHARSDRSGYWMSFAAADYNQDLNEDLFAGNLGGAVRNHAFIAPDPKELFEPVMTNATIYAMLMNTKHDTRHSLINGSDYHQELNNTVLHSGILPPDISFPNNIRKQVAVSAPTTPFNPNEINAYEFAWGTTPIDVQNDGWKDIYYVGGLYGRGGGLFSIPGTSPGRLLVNASKISGAVRFEDQTASHHLFNIEELIYDSLISDDSGFVYRPSPKQNWGKRDIVRSFDRSNWVVQGVGIQERITNQDLIQASENGRAAIAADLNGDGFEDILVRNKGGYDSRRSNAKNLKVKQGNGSRVLPAHNNNYPSPTNFDPGRTWVFVNKAKGAHWIKVRLQDTANATANRFGVGARIIVNNRHLEVVRSGMGGFQSNRFMELVIGLGEENAESLDVVWPDKSQTHSHFLLPSLSKGLIIVNRGGIQIQPVKEST